MIVSSYNCALKQIRKIFGITSAYLPRKVVYTVFNLLASVFSVFSIVGMLPFLKVIFMPDQTAIPEPADFGWSGEEIKLWGDYQLRSYILQVGNVTAIYWFSLIIIFMFFLRNGFNYLSFFNMAYMRSGVVRDLRQKVYNHAVDLPLSYYSSEKKGDLLSRLTNDVKEIEWGVVGAIEMLLKHPFYILLYLSSLFLISWQLTLFSLLVLPVSALVISRLAKMLKRTARKGQARLGEVISIIEETLGGLKVIKSFSAEGRVKQIFGHKNQEHFKLMVKLHRRELAASPLSEFMGSVVIAALLIFGGQLVLNEEMHLTGEYFLVYIGLFSQLITPVKALSEAYFRVQKADASMERLEEILHAEIRITEKPDAKVFEGLKESVTYENVSFSYKDKSVLHDISFTIAKGSTVALVGQSGGGKSTLVDLLPRFYDVKSGRIAIDGTDIRDFTFDSLRGCMGIVTQESVLFNDTVANNIMLGKPDAAREEVEQAARIANAHEFIMQMEYGYDTYVGDRGSNLSGGQRQRLSIARAVLNDPEILILDEATSALDTESEKLVQDALEKLMKSRTSLVIAHRLSTIKNANKILVIENGRITESGSHEELIRLNKTYKRLFELQSF